MNSRFSDHSDYEAGALITTPNILFVICTVLIEFTIVGESGNDQVEGDEMGRACSTHEMRNAYSILDRKLKGKDHLEDLGAGGKNGS